MILSVNSPAGTSNITLIVAAITFLGVVINVGFSYFNNKQGIKANVVSKARIEWIQNVREEAAKLISRVYEYFDYSEKYEFDIKIENTPKHTDDDGNVINSHTEIMATEKIINPKYKRDSSEIETLKYQMLESLNLIRLYFGPDQSNRNNIILNSLDTIEIEISQDKPHTKTKNDIKVFTEELRIYLKVEWLRASGVIKDNEVDEKYENMRNSLSEKIDELYLKKYPN